MPKDNKGHSSPNNYNSMDISTITEPPKIGGSSPKLTRFEPLLTRSK